MKTFIKVVACAATVEVILFVVAYLISTYTSCAKEIGLGMVYSFGILVPLSMGCLTCDNPDRKMFKFLFSLFFVAIYFAMQSLTIFAMVH